MSFSYLVDALLLIKDNLQSPKDELLERASKEHNVPYGILEHYHGLLSTIAVEDSSMTKAGDRKWSDEEHLLLSTLLKDLKGVYSKNKIFELVSPLFDRTKGGISFYYYHGFKERDTQSPPQQQDDLFFNLETIAVNMEHLVDVDLNELFKSLARLSTLAVNNQNQSEVEELEEELAIKEATLLAYEKKLYEKDLELTKKDNELVMMKREILQLKEVVQDFESLSNGKKLSKLREYSSQIKELLSRHEVESA